MKKSAAVFTTIILSLVLGFTASANGNTGSCDQIENDRYSYEVGISDESWMEMTYTEKVEAYSISQEILEDMTTQQLVQAVMDYPFLVDLTLFNTLEEGYAQMCIRDRTGAVKDLRKTLT